MLFQASEKDDRFFIAPSTIPGAGDGLFARIPLLKGDRLEVVGVVIDHESITNRCTRFADEYKLRFRDRLVIPLGYAGMINHSPRPNMEKDGDGERFYLKTLRDIEANEELFITYSDYAQERFLQS